MTLPALRTVSPSDPPLDDEADVIDLHRDAVDWWAELRLSTGEHVLAVIDYREDGAVFVAVPKGLDVNGLDEVCERKMT